ncbi:MAG: glycosyltransferase 87 family protein [Acidobacteriia bacterium]|nr:glycosyltransferase 87 family protein [Terriglobia bacterium]
MALRWLLRIGALAGIGVVLIPALNRGWTNVETDFPNYYTAAVLTLRHAPLRNFYDWTWFQRELNYAGWGMQLGGYIPHSPLTMLPMLPLARLAPMTAKRVWLALNVAFLLAAIWILARLSGLPAPGLMLLAMAGYQALSLNFVFGQYYVFVLLLLAVSFWFLLRGREFWAGSLLGAIFVLKLYAGPFLLYFAWKRQWRAAFGMAAACGVLVLASIGLHGWKDNLFYVTDVLPRALAGESTDPYAPGLATISNMLRHAFVSEPELNPHPLANLPWVAFFLQPLATLAAAAFCLLALPRSEGRDTKRELAWFLVMLLLVTPSRAPYMGVMLLIPVAFLWEQTSLRNRVALAAVYLALTVPWPQAWSGWFPSVWILLGLYIALGIEYWRKLRPMITAVMALAILLASGVSANRRLASYRREPPQKFERIAVQPHAIYSASPAVSARGIVYESIGKGRYELVRWNHGNAEIFSFDGHAFHPSVAPGGRAIYFELVDDGLSRILRYDPSRKALETVTPPGLSATRPSVSPDEQRLAFIAADKIVLYSRGAWSAVASPAPVHDVAWWPDSERLIYSAGPSGSSQIYAMSAGGAPTQLTHGSGDHTDPAVSPDGRWLAYTVRRAGTQQIFVEELSSANAKQLTEGSCNNYSPAWEPDSSGLVFASDCERGLGLPALYRWPSKLN